MKKTSEWLFSFASDYENEVKSIIDQKKFASNQCRTVSITGGKGGVGKTSISIKFAQSLVREGYKTLLIDCDYNLSNTGIKLGLNLDNSFYDLIIGNKSFDETIHKEGDFHLMTACNGSVDLFDGNFRLEEFIIDVITAHSENYDYILLDCPAGLSREALTLNAYCDHRIVVATPDRSSITDSYSLIKVLNQKFYIKENFLLINMFNTPSQFEKVVKTISETGERFLGVRTNILGGLPKIAVDSSRFDTFFLAESKNELNYHFDKVVKKYTEADSKPMVNHLNAPLMANSIIGQREQEVRQ